MNDLRRAHGKFDVGAGLFSFYSELTVKNEQVTGYVKPLFRNVDVYDQEQGKTFAHKVYGRVVGGVAKLLENRPQAQVATRTKVEGPVDNNPRALPGFDPEVRQARR